MSDIHSRGVAVLNKCECTVCRDAAGTLISEERDMKDELMTSVVLKKRTAVMLLFQTGAFAVCRDAAGTLISEERDMKDELMTSIVLKKGITLLDIVSTRMLGQVGFMAKVFDIFNSSGISVDVVATSEVSISLTLDPRYGLLNPRPKAANLRVRLLPRSLVDVPQEAANSCDARLKHDIDHTVTPSNCHGLQIMAVRFSASHRGLLACA